MSDWARVREVFEMAAELAEPARGAYLDEACAGNADLRARVERLLASEAAPAADLALDRPVPVAPESGPLATGMVGKMLGSYRVTGVLGQGGMGVVFAARQEQPDREVAVKMLSSVFLSPAERARFDYEVEALGRLQHPAIAQVFEAGTWEDPATGRSLPWFAMERVRDARPLDRFVSEAALGVRQRVELLAEIGEAVQHGHAHGILHRDLKPDNVLIDGAGRPKIIDFGTARSTDPAGTRHTRAGMVLGTPLFMSPEQFEGDPALVDAQSDVYALGVMLFLLLTDRYPLEPGQDSVSRFAERVRRTEAPRPSSLRTGLSVRGFEDDLDWICLEALAKEKCERYPTVASFVADLRSFLAHEPITAGPVSATRVLRRFVRRHRALVWSAAAVLLTLVAGSVVATVGWVQASRATRLAQAEGAAQKAALDWFTDLAKQARTEAQGRDVRLLEVLEQGEQRMAGLRDQSPAMEAAVRCAIASTFLSLELPERALALLDGGRERADQGLDPRHSALSTMHYLRGYALSDLGRGEEALVELRRARSGRESLFGVVSREVGEVEFQTAVVESGLGRVDAAVETATRAVATLRSALGPDDRSVLLAEGTLAKFLNDRGETDRALARIRDVRKRAEAILAQTDITLVTMLGNEAAMLAEAGRPEEALPLMERALAAKREAYGDESPAVLKLLGNIAVLQVKSGQPRDAERAFREIIAIHDHNQRDPIQSLITRNNLAATMRRDGRHAEALQVYGELFERAQKFLPATHWLYGVFRVGRGASYRGLSRHAEAEADLLAALAVLSKEFGDGNPKSQSALRELIALYGDLGRADDRHVMEQRLEAGVK